MRTRRRTRTWRLLVAALLFTLAGVFALLRGLHSLADTPTDSAIFTSQVAVVGVTGRYDLNDTDRAVLDADLDAAQAGAVTVRPRLIGDCAAAGWTTLGAGRRAAVGGLCTPEVAGGAVVGWEQRLTAARARSGDAHPGTLAAAVRGCVAAVGPGAALAAARPDGTLAAYQTPAEFRDAGAKLACPITLIDAGAHSDELIRTLAGRPDVTLFVTGIGPDPGSDDAGLQVIYRLRTTLPGWLTSAGTRREGIVTLTDLTQTLIRYGNAATAGSAEVDGTPLQVYPAPLSVDAIDRRLAAVAALSDSAVTGYLAMGTGGAVLLPILLWALWRRRFDLAALIIPVGTVFTAAMMLPGAFPWPASDHPGLWVGVAGWGWVVVLSAASLLLGRRLDVPPAIVAAALTVAAFTVDAALGGVMQPGSLLNSRPVDSLRWYGFGNVTFAAYATAGLLLAGYLASRLTRAGRPRLAVLVVGAICFGIVACEGWPSMGADFGGVIALTPAALWLLFALSGVRITWARLLALAAGGIGAITLISVLDWQRGPGRWSHLGNFVQRILDGDATEIVVRKAVASAQTITGPMGIICLLIGIPLWWAIFRYGIPLLTPVYSAIRPVAIAVLLTAVLGTLLNDGGISVWLTATGAMTCAIASLLIDRARAVPAAPAAREVAVRPSRSR